MRDKSIFNGIKDLKEIRLEQISKGTYVIYIRINDAYIYQTKAKLRSRSNIGLYNEAKIILGD